MIVVASTPQAATTVSVHHTVAAADSMEEILTVIVFPTVLGITVSVLIVLGIYSYMRCRRLRTTAVTETVAYMPTAENGKCLLMSNVCS